MLSKFISLIMVFIFIISIICLFTSISSILIIPILKILSIKYTFNIGYFADIFGIGGGGLFIIYTYFTLVKR